MQFTIGTTLKKREFPDIPELEYDFKKFSEIISGNFRSDLLIDVIGDFDKLIFYQTQSNLKKVIFSLKDFCGDVISCTLWEAHAIKFLNFYNNQPTLQPLVILLTNARVKEGQCDYTNSTCNVLTAITTYCF
ncbi:putative nucleic acid-binding protein [Lupinus albus]|uniref:Putative nucleic acid-binding protein n=1 Tax=Lupinus albus TaxID=3870 RepID=A0A6A4NK69_LUPAL|nr:putative nucleic acid-binding protein [Lupinus albus]